MAVTITEGTQTNIKSTTDSGAEIQHTRADGGTIASLSNLDKGTVTALASGTITAGTVALVDKFGNEFINTTLAHEDGIGTSISAFAVGVFNGVYNGASWDRMRGDTNGILTYGRHPDAFATVISQSGTALGTVKAGVAGSAHYITDMTISAQTEAQCALYAGSTLVRAGTYYFADNGGMVNNLNTPISIEAGSEITFRTIGTGLVTLEVRGYVD